MSKIYFHSEYTKDIKHIMNYLVYAGEKLEAQEIILNNGEVVSVNPDEIIDFTKFEDIDKVQVHTKSGRDVSFTPNEYNLLIKQDKEIEHMTPKGYIDYIGERPGVVKDEIGGLFSINGSISTDEALKAAQEYSDNTWWINILSLKRTDAERVGFHNRESFENLVRSKIPDICKNYNISLENLIIYGAYHDKINNPHIHLFFTSKDNREGFVRDLKQSSFNMKSNYFNTIYKEDMKILYQEKDTHKKELNNALETSIKNLSAKSYITDRQVLNSFVDLSNALKTEKGKLQYGYLSKENKRLVDELLINIVNKDKEVSKCFYKCLDTQEKFIRNYTDDEDIIKDKLDDYTIRLLMPYSKQKDNVLQNILIKNVANYNKKYFDIDIYKATNDDFIELSNTDPKFMYKLGKEYLYNQNNPLGAEDYLFRSYMIKKDKYTAFELGNTMLKLDDIQSARNYFNEYHSKVDTENITHPYEFYTLSRFYEFYKEDFKDLSQYYDKYVLTHLTDEFILKKEQDYNLQEYLNLKVSANLGYSPAIQKIKDIEPIKLTDNMDLEYSIHNNNPYIMTELKELVKESNITNKDDKIYDLSTNIERKLTYNEVKQKINDTFNFDENVMLAKSYLDLSNISKEVYLSKNIFGNEENYINFCDSYYDKFLHTVQSILKTNGKEDEKINLSTYLLNQGEQDVANIIVNNVSNNKKQQINNKKTDYDNSLDNLTPPPQYIHDIPNNVVDEKYQYDMQTNIDLDYYNSLDSLVPPPEYINDVSSNIVDEQYQYDMQTNNDLDYYNSLDSLVPPPEHTDITTDENSKKESKNTKAFDTYILGKDLIHSSNYQDIQKGINILNSIITDKNKYASSAMYTLGKYYFYSNSKEERQQGIKLLENAVNNDNFYAVSLLSKYYLNYPKNGNAQKAIKILQKAIDKGDKQSRIILGQYYLNQREKEYIQKGIDLLNPLIYDKNIQATFILGRYFINSKNENEQLKGLDLLKKNTDHSPSKIQIGKYYLYKENESDIQEGINILQSIIYDNQNPSSSSAMYTLGKYYFYQNDSEISKKGLDLIKQASDKKHTYAKLFLINHNMKSQPLSKQDVSFLKSLALKNTRDKTKERNSQAVFLLAKYYLQNDRPLIALPLLNYSANIGNDFALIMLSEYYLKQDHDKLKQKGIDNLNLLIANKNEQAMFSLGKFYLKSDNEQEVQQGINLLEKAVDKKHIYSMLTLGNYYLSSDDTSTINKGISLLEPLVKEDNEQAMYYLGKFYLYNEAHQDIQKGVNLLEQAVAKEHIYATLTLGNYYLSSDDTATVNKGIDLLTHLVKEDNEQAMFYLGKFYLHSENTQYIQKGISLLEKSTDKGQIYAKLPLTKYYINNNIQQGYKYLNDLKHSDDEYLRTSANRISSRIELDRGNLKSAEKDLLNVYHSKYVTTMDKYNLGHIYDKQGNDVLADTYYKEALIEFKTQNTAISNYMLGIMYLTGRGCEKDKNIAKEYFNKADEQGHPNAKEMITSINKQTIYACSYLLTSIAYHLMNIANQNYDYNKNMNKHKSKNNLRKPKIYRISRIQENTIQKTKSQENNHDYSLGY